MAQQSPISSFVLKKRPTEAKPPSIQPEEVVRAKEAVWSQNEFELIGTETRNVLFLGKTRSGKSTAVAVMKNPCYAPESFTIFSETYDAKFQSFSIQDKSASDGPRVKEFTLQIIDTPGLFEVVALDGPSAEARTNDSIIKTIQKCLENEITKLNCVVMFASIDAGVTTDDVEAIRIFATLFGNQAPETSDADGIGPMRMALCVTRADSHDDHWQDQIREQLTKHPALAPIIRDNNIQILFMGCVEPKRYYNVEHLLQGYQDIYCLRQTLLQFIMDSKLQQKLLELDLMKSKKHQVLDTLEILIDNFRYFLHVTDWDVQAVQQRMEVHKANSHLLSEHGSAYFSAAELAIKFSDYTTAAREFFRLESVPLKIRSELVWPLQLS